jgi:cytochrome c peroxidase
MRLLVALLCLACAPDPGAAEERLTLSARELRMVGRMSPLPAVPPDPTNEVGDDPRAAELGRALFFEKGLSGDGTLACSTCHVVALGLSDGRSLGRGVGDLPRHVPSLWNVAHQRWWFWDGRADTLWGQAAQPIEHPLEMNGDRVSILRLVLSRPPLRRAYEELFGKLPALSNPERFPERARPRPSDDERGRAWAGMATEDQVAVSSAFANLCKTLAAHERRLVSGPSAFDLFALELAEGKTPTALAPAALRGLRLFLGEANCRSCHFGPVFSDLEFHDTRVPPLGGGEASDAGRLLGVRALAAAEFGATSPYSAAPEGSRGRLSAAVREDGRLWGQFKTPSLRNVALSPPYMHQGQFKDLAAVVRYYSTLEGALPTGHHEEALLAPLHLDDGEQADLVAFLQSLTSEALDPQVMVPPGGLSAQPPQPR